MEPGTMLKHSKIAATALIAVGSTMTHLREDGVREPVSGRVAS